MGFESPENKHIQKQERWDQVAAEVENIRDRLGKEIDPGIKQAVVALRTLGFKTDASCEGHLNRGHKAPWVDVGMKLKEAHEKGERADPETEQRMLEAQKEVLAEQAKLLDFLSEFYENRQVPIRSRLILNFFGNSARLINQGEGVQGCLTAEEQLQHLNDFRQEMADFTDFLKDRFFRA